MQCEQVRSRLADFLGGEMSSADAAQVHDHLARCAACEREVRGLREAVGVLREGELSHDTAQERAEAISLQLLDEQRVIRGPFAVVPALLRYAAVIAISFGGGYLMRSSGSAASPPSIALESKDTGVALAQRYEAASRAYPKAPGISKGLLALANVEQNTR